MLIVVMVMTITTITTIIATIIIAIVIIHVLVVTGGVTIIITRECMLLTWQTSSPFTNVTRYQHAVPCEDDEHHRRWPPHLAACEAITSMASVSKDVPTDLPPVANVQRNAECQCVPGALGPNRYTGLGVLCELLQMLIWSSGG